VLRVALILAATLFARPVGADEGFQTALPKPAFDFALNPDTGGLAVVVPKENEVVLYPRFVVTGGKGEPVVTRVGKMPVAIAYKKFGDRAYFAVVSHDDRELTLLDAVTLKPAKTFALTVPWPSIVLVSANPADPAVYYAGHNKEKSGVLGRVNLETMKDEGTLVIRGVVDRPSLSADGTRLYLYQGATGSGTGMMVEVHEFIRPRPAPASPKDQPAYDTRLLHRAGSRLTAYYPPMLTDPFEGFVVSEERILTASLDAEVATLPFPAALVSAARPVIYGFQNGRLAAASVNTHKVVGTAKLPLPVRALDAGERLALENPAVRTAGYDLRYRPHILEDAANKTLLVCTASAVVAVPVADMNLPDEPFLVAKLDSPLDYSVGQSREVRVTPVAGVTKVELTAAPDGMKLADGKLTWKPGETAVGLHPIKFKISAKSAERTVSLNARVTRPAVTLPFPVPPGRDYRPVISTDGEVAIFSGPDFEPAADGRPVWTPSVVAVIDLSRGSVAARRNLLVGVTSLAADAAYVYAGLADSDAVYVLNRKDLSEVKRIVTPSRVTAITPVNDRFVVVTTNSGGGLVLKVPEWETAELGDLTGKTLATGRPGHAAPIRFTEGWWANGVLYDAKFEKPRAVVIPAGYWRYFPGSQHNVWIPSHHTAIPPDAQKYENPESPFWFARWGVMVTGQRKLTNGLRDFGAVPNATGVGTAPHATVILADAPVVASLAATLTDAPARTRKRVEVVFQNLTDAKVGLRVPVLDEPLSRDGPSRPLDIFFGLAARPGGGFVAIVGDRLFVLPAQKFDPAAFPNPLRFSPEYPVAVVGDKPADVALPVLLDAAAPVEVTLRKEIKGVTLDKKTWSVKVDPEPILAALTDGIAAVSTNPQAGPGPGQEGNILDKYLAEVSPRFEKLTGRKPSGIPVWVPVSVIAQDKNMRTAEVDVGFFLDVPLGPVKAKAKALPGAGQKGPNPAPKVDPALTPAQVAELLREQGKLQLRVEMLEKKIDELNKKIDALTKALEAKKPKKD
jgi:hypothetical protein